MNLPTPDHTDVDAPDVPERAFSQGTGVLLQTVGMILFLSTCCVCSTAGLWDPVATRTQVIQRLQEVPDPGISITTLLDDPGKAGIMATVMFMTVGGLMMAVFGLGMQAGKLQAAKAAVVTHLALLLIMIMAGLGMWTGNAPLGFRIWHAVLTIILIAAIGFCIGAVRDLIRYPAPIDTEPLPEDPITYYNMRNKLPKNPTPEDIARHRAWLAEQAQKLNEIEKGLGSPDHENTTRD